MESRNDNNHLPRITVVTPSYNQGQFLEETIQSVLGQCYPNLEYIVMDGGSTDNSTKIIKKYEKHLAYWTSKKDGGQSAAINAGFSRATGDILGWLNSDDMYLPGALKFVEEQINTAMPQVLFGNCMHSVENSAKISGSDVVREHQTSNLVLGDYIIQPSSFWTKSAWDNVGILDESLTYGFDWEWFLRAKKNHIEMLPVAKYLSIYRIHGAHKTGTGGVARQAEFTEIYEKYAGALYRDLYLQCCRSGDDVLEFFNLIHRFRLHKVSDSLMRLKFPKLFRNANVQDVLLMLQMR